MPVIIVCDVLQLTVRCQCSSQRAGTLCFIFIPKIKYKKKGLEEGVGFGESIMRDSHKKASTREVSRRSITLSKVSEARRQSGSDMFTVPGGAPAHLRFISGEENIAEETSRELAQFKKDYEAGLYPSMLDSSSGGGSNKNLKLTNSSGGLSGVSSGYDSSGHFKPASPSPIVKPKVPPTENVNDNGGDNAAETAPPPPPPAAAAAAAVEAPTAQTPSKPEDNASTVPGIDRSASDLSSSRSTRVNMLGEKVSEVGN